MLVVNIAKSETHINSPSALAIFFNLKTGALPNNDGLTML